LSKYQTLVSAKRSLLELDVKAKANKEGTAVKGLFKTMTMLSVLKDGAKLRPSKDTAQQF